MLLAGPRPSRCPCTFGEDNTVGVNADGLRRMRGNTAVKSAARMGLVGRGVFYLILAALTLEVVLQPRRSVPQANANGALSEVARSPVGLLLVAAAGVGFVAFGMVRLAGAITDDRHGWLRRVSTAGQGLMYLALAATTASFVLGRHGAGSEQQQRRTASTVLGLPGGRALLAVAGLAVLGVGCWQLVVAAKGKFEDTLHTEQMSTEVHRLTRLTARVGIPARALALSPVGAFLVLAAVRSNPQDAKGSDAVLLELAHTRWGQGVVVLIAAGFVMFAAYSFLEARYRQVSSGA